MLAQNLVVRQTDMGVGFDQAGVDGASVAIPDASIGGRMDLRRRAYSLESAITQYDGGAVEDDARPLHHPRANDGVYPRVGVTDAGGRRYSCSG